MFCLVYPLFSFRQSFKYFATNPAIQCTELYEYCQTLGGKCFSIPSFQVAPTDSRSHRFLQTVKYLQPHLNKSDREARDAECCRVVFRCISCYTPVDCWTVGLHLRPFITVRWWDRRSSDRGSLSLCWQERFSRYLHLCIDTYRSDSVAVKLDVLKCPFSCSCQTGWDTPRVSSVKLQFAEPGRNPTGWNSSV